MNRVVIGVGSNIEPLHNIGRARSLLELSHKVLKESQLIHTKPIGVVDQADYVNGAVLLETALDIDQFNELLKDIEDQCGRTRNGSKFGPRTIDLDIVVWNVDIVDKDYYERDFLKKAVLECIPEFDS